MVYGEDWVTIGVRVQLQCEGEGELLFQVYGAFWGSSMGRVSVSPGDMAKVRVRFSARCV